MTSVVSQESVDGHVTVPPLPFMLGERTDLRSDFGLEAVDKAAQAPRVMFSYGRALEWFNRDLLPTPTTHTYGTITGRRVAAFLAAANELGRERWMGRAFDAVQAIQDVVDNPAETEAVAFVAPFEEWAKDDVELPLFVGWIQQMVRAYDEPGAEPSHVVRDDFNDEAAGASGAHGTVIRIGDGIIPVFVIEESAIHYGYDGRRQLLRQITIAKRYSVDGALALASRLSLVERERVAYLLDASELGVTPEEKEYILANATRESVQGDPDVRAWLEWCRNPPAERKGVWHAARALLDRVVDSSFIRLLAGEYRHGRKKA